MSVHAWSQSGRSKKEEKKRDSSASRRMLLPPLSLSFRVSLIGQQASMLYWTTRRTECVWSTIVTPALQDIFWQKTLSERLILQKVKVSFSPPSNMCWSLRTVSLFLVVYIHIGIYTPIRIFFFIVTIC